MDMTRPLTAKLCWCPNFFSSICFRPSGGCTTTIGLPEFYIRVHLKVACVWRKIHEAQSNDLLRTACSLMRLDTPLHGNNARGTKYTVYYASVLMHSVRKYKWLHSHCVRIKKAQSLPLLVYSLTWRTCFGRAEMRTLLQFAGKCSHEYKRHSCTTGVHFRDALWGHIHSWSRIKFRYFCYEEQLRMCEISWPKQTLKTIKAKLATFGPY